MTLANEIWKLIRDILFVCTGIIVTLLIAMGKVSPQIAPLLIPTIGAMFALPAWMRSDERRQRDNKNRNASSNGSGTDSSDDR